MCYALVYPVLPGERLHPNPDLVDAGLILDALQGYQVFGYCRLGRGNTVSCYCLQHD